MECLFHKYIFWHMIEISREAHEVQCISRGDTIWMTLLPNDV